jgi:DNA-binding transcriptional MocR family regulator
MYILYITIFGGRCEHQHKQCEGNYLRADRFPIKGLILAGKLYGRPLPSLRLLAKELRISVITTKRAYEELEKDALSIRPRQGSLWPGPIWNGKGRTAAQIEADAENRGNGVRLRLELDQLIEC